MSEGLERGCRPGERGAGEERDGPRTWTAPCITVPPSLVSSSPARAASTAPGAWQPLLLRSFASCFTMGGVKWKQAAPCGPTEAHQLFGFLTENDREGGVH